MYSGSTRDRARAGPEPRAKKPLSCSEIDQPAYWLPRQAITGFEACTVMPRGQRFRPDAVCSDTVPRPPMQTSARRRPASRPPGTPAPMSIRRSPAPPVLTEQRKALASAAMLSTSFAARAETLGAGPLYFCIVVSLPVWRLCIQHLRQFVQAPAAAFEGGLRGLRGGKNRGDGPVARNARAGGRAVGRPFGPADGVDRSRSPHRRRGSPPRAHRTGREGAGPCRRRRRCGRQTMPRRYRRKHRAWRRGAGSPRPGSGCHRRAGSRRRRGRPARAQRTPLRRRFASRYRPPLGAARDQWRRRSGTDAVPDRRSIGG